MCGILSPQMREWIAPEHQPLVLVAGYGAWLEDSLGRRYLDANSSIWTNIHGHNHPVLNRAIREQFENVAHIPFLVLLAPKRWNWLLGSWNLAGSSSTKVFFSDDGSTAIEVAIKMAVQYFLQTGRLIRRDLFLLKRQSRRHAWCFESWWNFVVP